jgi:predicted AlkP superfamily pyrophosphatase or phosphodiesterase
VIIVSVDGLMPVSYTQADARGLRVPTFREMMKAGAYSDGVQGVLPTLTYPSHTSIATGANPARHGIVTNTAWDPLEKNQSGWRWYAEDIRVPTLWQAARSRGLRTALVSWPVTVGAEVDAIVPEFWRASNAEDLKLIRAVSTPGLMEAVARIHPGFYERYTPPNTKDSASTDVATYLIEAKKPNLLMLHIFEVDHWQHENDVWSKQARDAIENADAQVARLIASAKKAGIWEQTVVAVVSDHGFRSYARNIRPGVWLREKSLVTLDDRNRVTDWKAVVATAGGTAFFYVKDKDAQVTAAVTQMVNGLAANPANGISRVLSAEQIRTMGGDPEALLAIEAAEGFSFTHSYTGNAIVPTRENSLAGHGWPPDRPEMRTSLIFYGPAIGAGKLEDARLIDVAPTVAQWLGLRMARAEGKPLAVPLAKRVAH